MGWGARTVHAVPRGALVIEYIGEVRFPVDVLALLPWYGERVGGGSDDIFM